MADLCRAACVSREWRAAAAAAQTAWRQAFVEEFGLEKAQDFVQLRSWRDKYMCVGLTQGAAECRADGGLRVPPRAPQHAVNAWDWLVGRLDASLTQAGQTVVQVAPAWGPHLTNCFPRLLCRACLLTSTVHKLRSKARYLDELEDSAGWNPGLPGGLVSLDSRVACARAYLMRCALASANTCLGKMRVQC